LNVEYAANEHLSKALLSDLQKIVGEEWLLMRQRDLIVYSYDSTPFRGKPWAVILPKNTEEIRQVVQLFKKHSMPAVCRGAGTSLSGGPVPAEGGIVVALTRMDKIIEIDLENGWVVVEPGIRNQALQKVLHPLGYWFPPDPASMSVATIGGNIGENAGGPHCLKYGVTSNHVLGLEMILPDGEIVYTGSLSPGSTGYDLTGLITGSEGTLAMITKAMLRISPLPESTITTMAVFGSCIDAAVTVFEIIKAGLNPSVLEMIEGIMLKEVNEVYNLGYSSSAEALLIIEVDGKADTLDHEVKQINEICLKNMVQILKTAESEEERELLWLARRGGTSALGRLKPDSAETDIVVPRSQLPYMVEKFREIGERHGVTLGALMHAGDGNCHPQIPFDASIPEEKEAAEKALWDVSQEATSCGGSISGEHGIGMEKIQGMRLMFSTDELILMRKLKLLFDPDDLFNPGKIFPQDVLASTERGNII